MFLKIFKMFLFYFKCFKNSFKNVLCFLMSCFFVLVKT